MENYKAFSASVTGESHIRKNTVCQDYSGCVDSENVKIAAVSDGHGDKACFRSNKGSEFAVNACIEGLMELSDEIENGNIDIKDFKIEKKKNEILNQLATGIIAKWNLLIQNDIKENPVNEEIEKFKEDPDNDIDIETLNKYLDGNQLNHIYGATLIACMIVNDMVIALQQGDGKCVLLKKDGSFIEPVPWDERCYMNITTSLCDEDAISSFRFYISDIDEKNAPAGIFAASDGIEDSYDNNEAMLCFYRLLCINIAEKGVEDTVLYLKDEWLSEISTNGSADDMSVAGIADKELLTQLKDNMQAENDLCILNENIKDIEERKKSMESKKSHLEKRYISLENDVSVLKNEPEKIRNEIEEIKKNIKENNEEISLCEKNLSNITKKYEKNKKRLDNILDRYNKDSSSFAQKERKIKRRLDYNKRLDVELRQNLEKEQRQLNDIESILNTKIKERDLAESEYKDYLGKYNELSDNYEKLLEERNKSKN